MTQQPMTPVVDLDTATAAPAMRRLSADEARQVAAGSIGGIGGSGGPVSQSVGGIGGSGKPGKP